MKKTIKIFISVCVFVLALLCAAGCAPRYFDIDGTSRELRLAGFEYRSLKEAQATGNYYTNRFENNFNSQDFYNYLYVNSRNYEFFKDYKAPSNSDYTLAVNTVANAAGAFLEFWNDNDGKPQYILIFDCVTEEIAEQVYDLLKTGAGKGFSWVLQKSVYMAQRGSSVALYTANAAKYLK
ncbi:MAG: hypothetical protein HPY94_05365 [Clostridia bacterium]|nr:hypothetical protein [Clostridia bacterium]